MDVEKLRNVTFDLSTLTLGEAGEAERQAGTSIGAMLRSPSTVRLLALFVHGLRTSAEPPSWSELSSLRLLDASPSRSPEPKDSPSPTSSD